MRNLATTHMLDRLAASFGEKCIETPVGFKWIAANMAENNALLGGESSGGLTILGHISGKGGIFASALNIEMLSKTGKHISELQEMVWKITGRMYTVEDNLTATADMRIVVLQRLKVPIAANQPPYPIVRAREDDGQGCILREAAGSCCAFLVPSRFCAYLHPKRRADWRTGWPNVRGSQIIAHIHLPGTGERRKL